MRIVIAGCGRVGRELAADLVKYGDDVSVLDDDRLALEQLSLRSFDGTLHLGLAYDVDTLREAGIEEADAFLAVTNSDNANLMAVQVAKNVFEVPIAIARLDDPAREHSYRALDVSFITGARLVSQVLVERVHEPEFEYHVSFATGDVQVVEMVLGTGVADVSIADLEIDRRLRVAAVQRDGNVFIPTDETTLSAGDLVVAAVTRGTAARVREYLYGPGEAR